MLDLAARETYNCTVSRLRSLSLVVGLVTAACLPATVPPPEVSAHARPRLAVLVVVDQMRGDYLDRYADLYTGGLARLRREGAWFTAAHVAHALTWTAPGHASLATGSHPSRHGVIANSWFDRDAGQRIGSVDDPHVQPALAEGPVAELPGRSPRLLMHSTLGDWLKVQQPAAQVVAVALKDRAAILLGGHHADRAYWYSDQVPGFVSSTWYADAAAVPAWVAGFNAGEHSLAALDRVVRGWTRIADPSAYLRSGPDRVEAEFDGVRTEFPHTFAVDANDLRSVASELAATPFGDVLALQFAEALISAEGLGSDGVPDLLLLSCSAADYIGHRFGPYSHEVQDYYLRLDRELGRFMAGLDARLGPGGYVLALSADHGVLPLPEEANLRGHHAARRVLAEDYRSVATTAVAQVLAAHGLSNTVLQHLGEDGVWLDITALPASLTPADLRRAIAEALGRLDFVADAFTSEELSSAAPPQRPFLREYQRSYYPGRSPDVHMRHKQWHLVDARSHGTNHGMPYAHDTHVPVIFYGAGVRAGQHTHRVHTVDVAPTLAALLGVQVPVEIDGRSLARLVAG